jgi:hypothetical protein
MGRLVVCTWKPPDPAQPDTTLTQQAIDTARKAAVAPRAALWSLPLNAVVSRVTLAEDRREKSWIAYALADAVGPIRVDKGYTTPSGESAYTIPLRSPDHDPRAALGHQLLRIPAANQRDPQFQIFCPGERIAADQWFAQHPNALVILLETRRTSPRNTPRDPGTLPEYELSIDPSDIDAPAPHRVRMIGVFPNIKPDTLASLLHELDPAATGPPTQQEPPTPPPIR